MYASRQDENTSTSLLKALSQCRLLTKKEEEVNVGLVSTIIVWFSLLWVVTLQFNKAQLLLMLCRF